MPTSRPTFSPVPVRMISHAVEAIVTPVGGFGSGGVVHPACTVSTPDGSVIVAVAIFDMAESIPCALVALIPT